MRETILHIDDEPAVAAALSVRLLAAGYNAVTASNGRAGLSAAREHQPDVIVLDMRMPGMNGDEVCRALKSDPATASIPVIFLSANVQDAAQAAASEAGGFGYLTKPYEPADLVRLIQSALQQRDPAVESIA